MARLFASPSRTIGLIWIALACAVLVSCSTSEDSSTEAAFDIWLEAAPDRAEKYRRFSQTIDRAGLAEVVPVWQLLRVDASNAGRCDTEFFAFPPEEMWGAILPTLRLLRDEVVPVTGPLEVMSGYRSPEVNECIGGASQSRHLTFRALDLVPAEPRSSRKLFTDLCVMHKRLGRSSGFGLGVYFDLSFPARNTNGRFHVDSAGYRRWGYDYTSKSDPCPEL